MQYISTRGYKEEVPSHIAIKNGMAPDGGLYVPAGLPRFEADFIYGMQHMDYLAVARAVLSVFLDDYPADELAALTRKAYLPPVFPGEDPVPVRLVNGILGFMELWHGPTAAFKDIALQLLPGLLTRAVEITGEKVTTAILVATSGDTGSAAMAGFRDTPGTRVIVFYPRDGVSPVQKAQMVTQDSHRVHAVGVSGNFDDTQRGVKEIFADQALLSSLRREGIRLSSANSINWGRLVPQIVYYFHAYASFLRHGRIRRGDPINLVVPTGNFGNILAAYYAMKMGLPVGRLICASNINHVLTDFILQGHYQARRPFVRTVSPSMDILVSSNLERLLYDLAGGDSVYVTWLMNSLRSRGAYTVNHEVHARLSHVFWGGYSPEKSTLETIADIYGEYGYLIDTHTAVGVDVYDRYVISTRDMTPAVIASTASPFKFSRSVAEAILPGTAMDQDDEFTLLKRLAEKTGSPIPAGLENLENKPVKQTLTCTPAEMKNKVVGLMTGRYGA